MHSSNRIGFFLVQDIHEKQGASVGSKTELMLEDTELCFLLSSPCHKGLHIAAMTG